MIPKLWLCAGRVEDSPGCDTSIYISCLDDLIVFSAIVTEAWHHFARGIKTAFLSIVVLFSKITHPPPKKQGRLLRLWGNTFCHLSAVTD